MAKKAPTKKERDWMSKVAEIGCLIAFNKGEPWTPAIIHHCTHGGWPRNHFRVIPLAPCHHDRDAVFGESVHNGYKTFKEKYGTEQNLLEQVEEMLN